MNNKIYEKELSNFLLFDQKLIDINNKIIELKKENKLIFDEIDLLEKEKDRIINSVKIF